MNIIKKNFAIWTIVAMNLVLTSCAGLKNSQQALQFDKSYCNKQTFSSYTKDDVPKPFHELKPDTALTNRFSDQSLNIANAIGLIDVLTKYTHLQIDYSSNPTLEKKVDLLEYSQHINQKLNIASLEISALASELDCEEERANQFAYYLKEREGKTEKGLIIGSIIVGAAGAVVTEVISNNSSNEKITTGLTIGISLTEATLGALMLINKRKIEFYHNDNALTDIWKNSDVSNYFPSSIWYYLTYENPNNNEKSLAKLLVDKWMLFGQISSEKKKSTNKTVEVYFGKGGQYRADDLQNRADMLDQTEAYVTLMKQDLKILAYEIEKLYFK